MKFKASETFWKNFYALSPEQKERVREKWELFKQNQFHPSLNTHRAIRLSALHKTTVQSVTIEGDLKVVFLRQSDETIYTIDIGSHDIYQ